MSVTEHFSSLQALKFSAEQIVSMVAHNGGSKNIKAVTEAYNKLKTHYSHDEILKIASQPGGSGRLYQKLKELDSADALLKLMSEINFRQTQAHNPAALFSDPASHQPFTSGAAARNTPSR